MTILHTPNYGVAYIDGVTPLDQLANVSQQVAQTVDAALGRGGIAPPDATTQAQLAARTTTLETNQAALVTNPPRAVLAPHPTTGQTLGNNAYTTLNWQSAPVLSGMLWSTAQPSRLIVQTAGLYLLTGCASWALNSAGDRMVALLKNGVTLPASAANSKPPGAYNAVVALPAQLVPLAVNDYIEMVSHQNSGVALAATVGSINQLSYLSALRVA